MGTKKNYLFLLLFFAVSLNTAGAYACLNISGLSERQIRDLPRNQISQLCDKDIEALNVQQKAAIQQWDPQQVQAVTTPQMGVHYFVPVQITDLANNQIFNLDSFQYSVLSIQQKKAMNIGQVQNLNTAKIPLADIPAEQRANLLPSQIKVIPTSALAAFDNALYTSLSKTQVLAMSTIQVQALNTVKVSLTSLPPEQVPFLASDQIGAIPAADFISLPPAILQTFTPAQMGGVTNSQFSQLSATQRNYFRINQIQGLDLSKVNISLLSLAQLANLLPAQFRKVTGAYFGSLNAVQLAVLKAPQIQEINTAQVPISSLFVEQRDMLTETQVKAIGNSLQLESLPKSKFKYLDVGQVSWLTKAQIDSLTRSDIIEIVKANPDLLTAFINTGKMRGEQSYWGKAVLFTKEAREITRFYYDHDKGKMLPEYEGLTPEEVPACVADGLCWRTKPKKDR